MYTILEYDSDPLLKTTTTTTIPVVDDDNETSPASTRTIIQPPPPPPPPPILPKNEFHIRWTNHNNHDVDDVSSAPVTTTIVECVPVVHSKKHSIIGYDYHSNTTTSSSTNNNNNNNNKNNIFLIIYQSILSLLHSIQNILYELLLPYQYPNSVRDGYLQYQIYDSLQGLCSYLRNIVCSAALFQAVVIMNHQNQNNQNNNSEDGIGNDDITTSSSSNSSVSSTAWNAAIVWAIRDGTGLMGSLLYTYMISTYLDAYVKEFRFFADIINDIGFTFDMILPYIDDTNQNSSNNSNNSHTTLFWIVSSMSVLCKMMCGVSAGATKSSITCHFAIQGNMADLNAKESTQETMVTLIGMIGGIYVAKLLQSLENDSVDGINSRYITWMFFLLLTLIHIYANYLGVSLLRLRTINTSRIDPCLQNMYKSILLPDFRSTILKMNSSSTNQEETQQQQQHDDLRALLLSTIVSPTQIREIMFLPVWQFFGILPSSCIYCNTIPYHQLQPYFHQSLLGQIIVESKNKDSIWFNTTTIISSLRYNVTIMMNHDTVKSRRIKTKVAITLLTGATSNDEFQAYIHAKLIVVLLLQLQPEEQFLAHHISLPYNTRLPSSLSSSQIRQVFIDSYQLIQLLFQLPQPNPETNESDTKHEPPLLHVPLIIDILQQKDWDVSRFYFNYPPRRCQLVLDTTIETPKDNNLIKLLTNKKDD